MTKAEIVEQIYERVGFSKKESAELVERVFDIIKDTLSDGEKVKISGFGNFVVREKNARKGRNPQTGQEILLDARRVGLEYVEQLPPPGAAVAVGRLAGGQHLLRSFNGFEGHAGRRRQMCRPADECYARAGQRQRCGNFHALFAGGSVAQETHRVQRLECRAGGDKGGKPL